MFSFFTSYYNTDNREINPDNKIQNLGECSLCFETKNLHSYCEHHEFCLSCSKEWYNNSVFCPVCRKTCSNIFIKKYNYTLIDIDYDTFDTINYNNIKLLFDTWHKNRCIRRNHQFYIMKEGKKNKKLIMYCTVCNIEESFPYQNNSE